MSKRQWATSVCTPLPEDGVQFSTGVNTGESTTEPYVLLPANRMRPLLTLIQGSINETSTINEQAMRDYTRQVIDGFVLTPAVLFIIIAVILIPCWVCRCMSHKGPCKPRKAGYNRRHKVFVSCCCFIFFALTLTFASLASVQMLNLTPGMRRTLCGTHNLMSNVTGTLLTVDTKLRSLDTALIAVKSDVSTMRDHVNCL